MAYCKSKFFKVIFVGFIFLAGKAFLSWADGSTIYTIQQLNDDQFPGSDPCISNGNVAWSNWDGNAYQVFFYNGTQTKQLTNATYTSYGSIFPYHKVDNGQVAWQALVAEDYIDLFLYDGTQTKQFGNSLWGNFQINNGQLAWQNGDDGSLFLYDGAQTKQIFGRTNANIKFQLDGGKIAYNRGGIFLYDGVQTKNISNDPNSSYYSVQNSNGRVIWLADNHIDDGRQLFFYNGTEKRQLTNNPYNKEHYQIDNGQVAWSEEGRIFLFDGTEVKQITDISSGYSFYSGTYISNGQITWQTSNGEVFIYDGTQIKNITDGHYCYSAPQINNGQVVWSGWDNNTVQIFVYDGTKTIQLTNNDYFNYEFQINNGRIVWSADGKIFLATLKTGTRMEILDGSDYSDGREVTDNVNKLIQGNTLMEGAVTDGVTRLLLRLPLEEPAQVTFTLQGTGIPAEDGKLKAIDGAQEGNTITVLSQTIDGKDYCFAVYQAPETFVRQSNSDDLHTSERIMTLQIDTTTNQGASTFTKEIKLVRPPVLLVHGGGPGAHETWVDTGIMPRIYDEFSGIQILCANYKPTSDSPLYENRNVVSDYIIEIKRRVKNLKIAAVQVDVIAYSMGGLLARIYTEGQELFGKGYYLNDKNFEEGDIHKLITLDTPHKGSFLANLFLEVLASPPSKDKDKFLNGLKEKGYTFNPAAIADLATDSLTIAQMNKVDAPVAAHAIAGDYIVPDGIVAYIENKDLNSLYFWGFGVTLKLNPDPEPYIIGNHSDLIVSLDSQQGNLTGYAVTTFGHDHLDFGTDLVRNATVELLNKSNKDESFHIGFNE